MAEESLVIVFGQEFRGGALEALVAWGLNRSNITFAYLGDQANSRGAADMGLNPALLPGYVPVAEPGAFSEYADLPVSPGKSLRRCSRRPQAGIWARCWWLAPTRSPRWPSIPLP